LVAQVYAGEGADAVAARDEGCQPADQVEIQILPQVIVVGAGTTTLTRRGGVRLVKDGDKVNLGDRSVHCSVPL
jgi:hypothetical protein